MSSYATHDAPSSYGRHGPRRSIADSTLSMGTYATGITGESLRLSQFPPPPSTLPNTPITPRAQGPPSPLYRSSPAASGSPTSAQHPHFPADLPPPPPLKDPPHGRRSAVPGSPPPPRQLSPYDWHDGSSSIDAEPPEGRMLSTSMITGLLSSADSVISNGTAASSAYPHMTTARYPSASYSEMTYPPPVLPASPTRRTGTPPRTPLAHLDAIHDVLAAAESTQGHATGDNDTLASYEGAAQVVRAHSTAGRALAHKVSVVGMAPARTLLRHVASGESNFLAPSVSGRESRSTYDSARPLYVPERARPLSQGVPVDVDEAAATFEGSTDALHRRPHPPSASPRRRASTHSNKSLKSTVGSLVSTAAHRARDAALRTREWLRVKPLPPVPPFENMDAQARRTRARETATDMPALALRADTLGGMLAQGRLPANSMYEDPNPQGTWEREAELRKAALAGFGSASEAVASGAQFGHGHGGRKRASVAGGAAMLSLPSSGAGGPGSPSKTRGHYFPRLATRRQKIRFGVLVAGVALLILIVIIVGAVVGSKKKSDDDDPKCGGRMTGADCSLDATCVCTAQASGSCGAVAASLLNLLPTVNNLFAANMSAADVSAAMHAAYGAPANSNCAQQARAIDVAPALGGGTPNRTVWAQAALMWSFVLSQSDDDVGKLRGFVRGADWGAVHSVDGPILSTGSKFQTTQMGWLFDFAAQTVQAPGVAFETDGQPSAAQFAKTDGTTRAALDKVYTSAAAMSTMRSTAIREYWQSTLGQDPNQYATFAALIQASPILLPFNANSSASALLTNSTTAPFPPPQACDPGLSSANLAQLSAVETAVFGLPAPTLQASFDTACFAARPIYGRLDYLRLRTPFRDAAANASTQAAALVPAARSRVVISNGAQFAALPLLPPASGAVQTDRRAYGTLSHMDHVLYNFFAAIADAKVAAALVQYVLSQASAPPTASALLAALDSLPVLEVAVLGSVTPDDLSGVVSGFATPGGALWFGSDQSLALRRWAVNGLQSGVAWAANASAPKVVRDNGFSDANFNLVWDPAFTFFHSSTSQTVNVGNITAAFEAVGKLTP